MDLHVGPFQLLEPVARGGSGEVWRAVHRRTGAAAAFKVLDTPRSGATGRHLRREIEAVASLRHPHVIEVFDCGDLPAEAARASGGRLARGSAWLAMEWASGGTLEPHVGHPLGRDTLHDLLGQLLDALSHAHARGVLHLDVKPANVLVESHGVWRLKLADFGVAHTFRQHGDRDPLGGTPLYMAPEQRERRWRDVGPWTDLYAVGRLTELLLRARGGDAGRGAWAGWLAGLLATEPQERFQTAADARWALQSLDAALPDAPWLPTEDDATLDTLSGTTWLPEAGEAPPEVHRAPGPARSQDRDRAAHVRAPIPESWVPLIPARARTLDDAGLAVTPWRHVPFVGRNPERDLLWSAMREVATKGAPRAVVVRGDHGLGASRLIAWLTETGEEAGATQTLTLGADFAVDVARALRISQVDPERWESALASDGLPAELARDLVAALRGQPGVDPDDVVARFVEARSAARPLVLRIDAEGAVRALNVARRVLAGEAPVLVAVAAGEGVDLGRWLDGPAVRVLDLAPMTEVEVHAIVRSLAPLDPLLRTRIVQIADGRPGIAEQVVRNLVESDALVPGPAGFVQAHPRPLTTDADAVVRERVARALQESSPAHVRTLEVIAALGASATPERWRAASDATGSSPAEPAEIAEPLLRAGLARLPVDAPLGIPPSLPGGVRRALLAEARDRGEVARVHVLAADLLKATGGTPGAIGLQLAEAGSDDALPLLRAALQRSDEHHASASQLLEAYERRVAHRPESDPVRGDATLLRAFVALVEWRIEDCQRAAAEGIAWAKRHGDARMELQATLVLTRSLVFVGTSDPKPLLEEAARRAKDLGNPHIEATVDVDLARLLRRRGELAEAEVHYRRAIARYLQLGSGFTGAEEELTVVLAARGDFAAARSSVHEIRAAAAQAGDEDRGHAADLLEAEVLRLAGDPVASERILRELLGRIAVPTGARASIARGNLGLCLLDQGRYRDAREPLHDMRRWAILQRVPSFEAVAHAGLLVSAVALDDAGAVEVHLERARALLGAGHTDLDLPGLTAHAARLAARLGRSDWAARIIALELRP